MSQQNPAGGPRSNIEQLKALEHLQELDLKIDQLKRNKGALPDALKALDTSIGKVQTTIAAKNTAVGEIEKNQRQARAALDINRDRLGRSNSKLESVQNSHEYTAVNKEIEQLRKQALSLEEQVKKGDTDTANVQKELADLGTQLTKVQQEREGQAQIVGGQISQIEKEITSLVESRKQYVGQVDARLLSQYDRVRGARAGIGIVPAVGGRCKGCNMMVPPQLFNEIRKGSAIHQCPSCYRILFVPVSSEGATG